MSFSSEKERLYADLSPAQRGYADFLLRIMPNFRYELSGRPRLYPMPAPGLESAVAAAKMVSVLLQAGGPTPRYSDRTTKARKPALALRHRRIG